MNSIPIIDLAAEYRELKSELQPAVNAILESGRFILGPEGEAFERELAAFHGVPGAVGVNSGTDALVLALRALDIGPGNDVIMPAFSFFATAEAVSLVGARPVFADIDPQTYLLSAEAARRHLTHHTKAIMAVHLYGLCAGADALASVAREHRLALIEDNAQAIGATWKGKNAGSFGDAAGLSFFPTKNLGAYGDAGAVLCSTPKRSERVKALRNHGSLVRYEHVEIGYNSRLDELQAAILRIKLRHIHAWNETRRQLAQAYREGLKGLPIGLPVEPEGARHVYHLFTIRVNERDALREHLARAGIASAVHYPKPMHLQPAMKRYGGQPGDCPEAESASREVLSLPLYPQLSDAQVDGVVRAIRSFYAAR